MTSYLRSVKGIAAWAIALCGIALLGWWLGSVASALRRPKKAESVTLTSAERIQRYAEQVRGLKVGDPFPDIPFWSPDGSKTFLLRDILAHGGVVGLLHPGCGRCIESAVAMQAASDSARPSPPAAVLITDVLQGAQSFVEELALRKITIPVYCDAESTLRLKYNLQGNFAYFRLGPTGLISSIGFVIEPSIEQFHFIVSNDSTQGTWSTVP